MLLKHKNHIEKSVGRCIPLYYFPAPPRRSCCKIRPPPGAGWVPSLNLWNMESLGQT